MIETPVAFIAATISTARRAQRTLSVFPDRRFDWRLNRATLARNGAAARCTLYITTEAMNSRNRMNLFPAPGYSRAW